MSVPPKYRPNQLSEEVKTYVVIDAHNRGREWTGNLKQLFDDLQEMDKPFFITDDGGVIQLLYVVSVDDLETFLEGEGEDAEE